MNLPQPLPPEAEPRKRFAVRGTLMAGVSRVDVHVDHVAKDGHYSAYVFTQEVTEQPKPGDTPEDKVRVIGTLHFEVCRVCLYTITTCAHEFNTWQAGGTALICDLCGADGT